ncbi:MAG: hypothetical protein M1825_004348 [Sarcosagium campestre]|nr:MAG: hypothetical protein M1825_004348 [Sarcosagium campestre]
MVKIKDTSSTICHEAPRRVSASQEVGIKEEKSDKQSLEFIVRSGLAGGLAGCAAKTVVGPLDRVKILFQASSPQFAKYTGSWLGVGKAVNDIYRQDGALGLFRGHSATLLRIFPYAAIKFLAYEQFRAVLIPTKDQETPFRRLVSGSAAGITSVIFTYPLEVVRVRLAFETKQHSRSSLSSICRQIYHETQDHRGTPRSGVEMTAAAAADNGSRAGLEGTAPGVRRVVPKVGIANFYRGFAPTLWGMLPYAGMSFLTHDTVIDLLHHSTVVRYTTVQRARDEQPSRQTPQLKYWAELAAGGIAGLVSQTIAYPLEVIRRRMQVGGAVGDGHRLGMAEVVGRIWAEKGARGFFVGLTIGYIKVVPMVATSFYVYGRTKTWLGI